MCWRIFMVTTKPILISAKTCSKKCGKNISDICEMHLVNSDVLSEICLNVKWLRLVWIMYMYMYMYMYIYGLWNFICPTICSITEKLEQLERLDTNTPPPPAPWLPTLLSHIESQVKRRQCQSYKFKEENLPKFKIFEFWNKDAW